MVAACRELWGCLSSGGREGRKETGHEVVTPKCFVPFSFCINLKQKSSICGFAMSSFLYAASHKPVKWDGKPRWVAALPDLAVNPGRCLSAQFQWATVLVFSALVGSHLTSSSVLLWQPQYHSWQPSQACSRDSTAPTVPPAEQLSLMFAASSLWCTRPISLASCSCDVTGPLVSFYALSF